MIMKYTPCTAADCTVTVLAASDSCTPCTVSGRLLRFLEDPGDQESAITFQIVSNTPLNEEEVLGNLNDGIDDANEDLSNDGITFSISGTYEAATLAPTSQPTKKPTSSVRIIFWRNILYYVLNHLQTLILSPFSVIQVGQEQESR